MRALRFLSPAETEMVAAARYYEAQSRNLGRRFLRHLQETVDSIVAFPYAGTAVRGDIRRRLVRQFPFAVFYSVAPEEILIIAVMDLRRDPEYWMNRV
jgi:plasmid stabilization system protein ParE